MNFSKTLTLILFFVLFLSEMLNAQTFNRFRCIWNDDPATTMTIGYHGTLFTNGRVYFDVVDHGQNVGAYAMSQAPDKTHTPKLLNVKFVRLKNLQPDTKYYFVVSNNGSDTSPRMWFKTASNDNNQRLSLIVGGDSRNPSGISISYDVRERANQVVAKLRPDAVVFGGDMTLLDTGFEWGIWFDDWQQTIAADGRMTPIIPARGNHETSSSSVYDLFDTPTEDTYYAVGFGTDLLRIYTLNSLISVTGNQATWLANDLASNPCTYWKLAQYHYPTRPTTSGKDERDNQRSAWSTLFDQFGVALVAESDAHLCKYTYPVLVSDDVTDPTYDEGFVRNDQRGVTYIGEGGWGAEIRPTDDTKMWTSDAGEFHQIKWVFVDKNSIEIRTIKTEEVAQIPAKTEADSKFTIAPGTYLWDAPNTGLVLTLDNPRTPPVVDLGPDQLLCSGCNITIDAGAGYADYLWSNGQTTSTINVNTPGTYSVTVTNIGACSKTDEIEIITVLPSELTYFQGKSTGVTNVLEWETAVEVNTDYFAVEASLEGEYFTEIGRIKALGNTTAAQYYRFVDANPLGATTYYRLRQVDVEESFMYSELISVSNRTEATLEVLSISPNPAKDFINIEFFLTATEGASFQILDINGRVVRNENINGVLGDNRLIINIRELPAGMYFFSLKQGLRQVTQKILIN